MTSLVSCCARIVNQNKWPTLLHDRADVTSWYVLSLFDLRLLIPFWCLQTVFSLYVLLPWFPYYITVVWLFDVLLLRLVNVTHLVQLLFLAILGYIFLQFSLIILSCNPFDYSFLSIPWLQSCKSLVTIYIDSACFTVSFDLFVLQFPLISLFYSFLWSLCFTLSFDLFVLQFPLISLLYSFLWSLCNIVPLSLIFLLSLFDVNGRCSGCPIPPWFLHMLFILLNVFLT